MMGSKYLQDKKRFGGGMAGTVECYGCEVWTETEKEKKNKLLVMEMDSTRGSAKTERLDRMRNEIRKKKRVKHLGKKQ
jgi:hypothetical protein